MSAQNAGQPIHTEMVKANKANQAKCVGIAKSITPSDLSKTKILCSQTSNPRRLAIENVHKISLHPNRVVSHWHECLVFSGRW